tara:strand:- start:30 stop:224 length:195 start_codon:yes stop_codon:yes gene_type:complete
MTLDDAIYELVSTWPENREVPELLRAAYDKVSGEDKEQVESLVEALTHASTNDGDLALIDKYWG